MFIFFFFGQSRDLYIYLHHLVTASHCLTFQSKSITFIVTVFYAFHFIDFKFSKIIINGYAQYAQYAWIVIQFKI